MILSVATSKDNTLLISVFEAQSKPVPNEASTSSTVKLSLHLTAENQNYHKVAEIVVKDNC